MGFNLKSIYIITRILPNWRIELFEEISKYAISQGFDIHFLYDKESKVYGEHYSSGHVGYLKAINFKIKRLLKMEYFPGLLKLLKKNQPDAIIVESSLNFWSTFVAVIYKKVTKKKVDIYGWSSGYFTKDSKVLNMIRYFIFNQFDGCFLYHNRAKKIFLDKLNISNTLVIGNSPGNKKIYDNIKSIKDRGVAEIVRNKYSQYKYIALFVGKLTQSKKVDVLINSAKELDKLGCCVVIIGDGPVKYELEQICTSNNVFFLGKIEEDVDAYFQAADIFIMPGTGGMALLQAAYNGLPVITGLADGIGPDIVFNNINGFITETVNEAFILQSVEKLINQDLFDSFSKEMIKVSENFKTVTIAKKMIDCVINNG